MVTQDQDLNGQDISHSKKNFNNRIEWKLDSQQKRGRFYSYQLLQILLPWSLDLHCTKRQSSERPWLPPWGCLHQPWGKAQKKVWIHWMITYVQTIAFYDKRKFVLADVMLTSGLPAGGAFPQRGNWGRTGSLPNRGQWTFRYSTIKHRLK